MQHTDLLTETLSRIRKKAIYERMPEEKALQIYAQALEAVNDHITISESLVEQAKERYKEIATYLVQELQWRKEDIEILPQGSAATQTLIRAPDRSDFDIDAVCKVDSARVNPERPIDFFDTIGRTLEKKYGDDVTRKNRCWQINYPNERFYLEFTPSVPMDSTNIPLQERYYRHQAAFEAAYAETALSVVDNASGSWKPSNPEGFASWVKDATEKKLLRQRAGSGGLSTEAAVQPVPGQSVGIEDTLRVAIRLFKRHRDICVRRNIFNGDHKPISVILVTLTTKAYLQIHDSGARDFHPIELLAKLAENLPVLVEKRNDDYWVENPTVKGENFAEKWNQTGGHRRKQAFEAWSAKLIADLNHLLLAKDSQDAMTKALEIFGVSPKGGGSRGGSGSPRPKRVRHVPPADENKGLA